MPNPGPKTQAATGLEGTRISAESAAESGSATGGPSPESDTVGAGAAVELDLSEAPFAALYTSLHATYGAQDWWPAETAFEVMLGAVLTQNTAWTNVEQALAQLRAQIPLSPEALLALAEPVLAQLIRPSGYFNVKARRLRSFCSALIEAGGESALAALPTDELRHWLLAINGIGSETADDILLYAFERPVFVVDAYTRRLFRRLGLIAGDEGYERIRQQVETALGPDAGCFNEFHALIVRHAKNVCRARRPACESCRLSRACQQRGGD